MFIAKHKINTESKVAKSFVGYVVPRICKLLGESLN